MLTFKEKGDDSGDGVFGPEHKRQATEHCSQVLKPNGFALLGLELLGVSFPFLDGNENV